MAKKGLINGKEWVDYLKFWSIMAPPARPSSFDIKIWETYIKKILRQKRDIKALVFGATPEIRDLLAKYKIFTTLLDVNPAMIKGLMKFMKYKKQRNEKVIIDNWLKIRELFSENSFDIVMGHDFFNNIPWSSHNKLASSIKWVLKKDGYGLIVSPILRKTKNLSSEHFVTLYKKNPKYFKEFCHRWYVVDVLKKLDYNKRTRQFFIKKIKERLIKEAEKQGLSEKDINQMWVFKTFNIADNYIGVHPPLKDLLNVFKKYFKIEKMSYWSKQGNKSHFNFVLRPKK